MIAWAIANMRLVGIGAVVLLFLTLGGMIWWKNVEIESGERKLAKALADSKAFENAADANLKAYKDLQEQVKRDQEAVEQDKKKTVVRLRTLEQRLSEIQNAPETDNAPAAPVLQHFIDGLRRPANPDSSPNR